MGLALSENEHAPELLSDLWQHAIELYDAWFHLASEFGKEQYRGAATEQQIHYHRSIMVGDLRSRLASGDLLAIGYLKGQESPIAIPRAAFTVMLT